MIFMADNIKKHIPALDGFRGLAILMVLFGHFSGEAILKQYYPVAGPVFTKIVLFGLRGVDLFFVLSGYLITSILLDSKGKQRFFINFYSRRFLRIFPVYYASLFLIFFIMPHIFKFDEQAIEISQRQIWLWGYVGNFPWSGLNWDSSDIFQLGHFWSLAVEQHFYLIWPFVITRFDRHLLKTICLSWFAVSSIAGVVDAITSFNILWLHWSSITHSGGLALGSYCAIYLNEKGELYNRALKIVYTCVPIIMLLVFIPRNFFEKIVLSIMYPLTWVMFSALLIVLVTSKQESKLTRLFENKILIKFGMYSYGIYIFHGIFRPLFEQYFPREALISATGSPFIGISLYFFLAISCSSMMAFVSWHAYEKHCLKLKSYFT